MEHDHPAQNRRLHLLAALAVMALVLDYAFF